MLVDFVVRSDDHDKPGGDSLQVANYVEWLERLGIDGRVVPFGLNIRFRPGAIVHIVNIDRPFEFLYAFLQAEGRRIFVSPIHHNLEFVARMRSGEHGYGLRSVIGRLAGEQTREWLAFTARSLGRSTSLLGAVRSIAASVIFLRHMPVIWRRVGRALNAVESVFVLALGEEAAIRVDTGWAGENSVLLPNGRSEVKEMTWVPWADRSSRILAVGRIEPRKRQLEVAREAINQSVPVTFVGPLHQPTSAFGRQFIETIDSSELLTWTGPLSHDLVLEAMSKARVLLNASWVEVQSLVDLEAAICGCYVVANTGGNTREWLPEQTREITGSSIPAMLTAASELSALGEGPSRSTYDWTWLAASETLRESYGRAASRTHSSADLFRGDPSDL